MGIIAQFNQIVFANYLKGIASFVQDIILRFDPNLVSVLSNSIHTKNNKISFSS